jgi:hypothetical protein
MSSRKRCIHCRIPYPKKKHKKHTWVRTPILIKHRRVQRCVHCGVSRFKPDKNIVYKIYPDIASITNANIEKIERDPIKRHLKAIGYV